LCQVDISFSVSGAQRIPVLLSSGESDGRPDAAVVPHSCQEAAQPYCVHFQLKQEHHIKIQLHDVETGSNSDIVLASSELPVLVTAPVLGSNSDIVHASSEHVPVSLPVPQLLPKRIVQVHSLNIKKDLIDLFRDPLIMSEDIEIMVIDARGVEEMGRGVGLLRDVFSLFWKETYDSLFVGENERVPFVRHDYQRDEWVAVGRSLVKGYLTCQYLPVLLSQTFLASLFGGNLL